MSRQQTYGSSLTRFFADFFAAERQSWHGETPLWKAFWVYGVVGTTFIAAIYLAAIYIGNLALQQSLLLCFAAYSIWMLVSVWKCAQNTREQFWTLLARFLTVAWAGNSILVLGFLQIDLVAKYLGH